jgi:dethiobiotin synthetase
MSFIIGIAGTAKNTGKTTASIAILQELFKTNISIGLTSIGYDGEDIDNITGLPKPSLFLKKGTTVATSEKCISGCTAQLDIIKTTNISTPLGKIIIAQVVKEGLVVIAGPNKSIELRCVLGLIRQMNCKLIIVDGALNRLAPMIETNGIILATGAARNTDIDVIVQSAYRIDSFIHSFKQIHYCDPSVGIF